MFSYLFKISLILSVSLWPFQNGKQGALPPKPSAYTLPSPPSQYAFIKIMIQSGLSETLLSVDGPYSVLDAQKKLIYSGQKLPPSRVLASKGALILGNQTFSANPLTIESAERGVRVKGAHYRQAIEIWREADGRLMLINDIPMEDYLKGVLPSEVNPRWPMESLKAQAVASRTYALFKIIENQSQRYHLSKDVLSQVYGGKNLENALTTQAVEETQGQILIYNNKVFPAYFHSTCGGRTTQAEFIWNIEPHPSLAGVECNFCWKSRHYRWNGEFPKAEIEKKLAAHGIKAAGLKGVSLGEKDATGRVKFFILSTAAGPLALHSNDFRLWISPQKLKSTWILSVDKIKGGYHFRGRGWGHGVGLCQFGTKQLGEMGYSAPRILNYYYPGAQLVQYWAEMPRSLTSTVKGLLNGVKEKLDLE